MSNHPPPAPSPRWSSSRRRQSLQTSSFFLLCVLGLHIGKFSLKLTPVQLASCGCQSTSPGDRTPTRTQRTTQVSAANYPPAPAAQPCWVLMQQRWDLDLWGGATLEKVTAPYISAHMEHLTSNQNTRSELYFTRAVGPRECFMIVGKWTQVYRCRESPNHFKKYKRKTRPSISTLFREQRNRDLLKLHNDKNKNRANQRRNALRWPLHFHLPGPPPPAFFLARYVTRSFSSSFYASLLAVTKSGDRRWFRDIYFCVIFFFFSLPP